MSTERSDETRDERPGPGLMDQLGVLTLALAAYAAWLGVLWSTWPAPSRWLLIGALAASLALGGAAIDNEQMVWVVNKASNTAVRIEPTRGGIVGTYPVGHGPHTYSDMTGYALHTFVARRGTYRIAYHAVPRIAVTDP